jgi:hypothetical protein
MKSTVSLVVSFDSSIYTAVQRSSIYIAIYSIYAVYIEYKTWLRSFQSDTIPVLWILIDICINCRRSYKVAESSSSEDQWLTFTSNDVTLAFEIQ